MFGRFPAIVFHDRSWSYVKVSWITCRYFTKCIVDRLNLSRRQFSGFIQCGSVSPKPETSVVESQIHLGHWVYRTSKDHIESPNPCERRWILGNMVFYIFLIVELSVRRGKVSEILISSRRTIILTETNNTRFLEVLAFDGIQDPQLKQPVCPFVFLIIAIAGASQNSFSKLTQFCSPTFNV